MKEGELGWRLGGGMGGREGVLIGDVYVGVMRR